MNLTEKEVIEMITLELNKAHEFKVGEVINLKIVAIEERGQGRWRLTAEDVTPLPGAEPAGYCCDNCGIIEAAKPDGSLPEGWTVKEDEYGSCFVCPDPDCQEITEEGDHCSASRKIRAALTRIKN